MRLDRIELGELSVGQSTDKYKYGLFVLVIRDRGDNDTEGRILFDFCNAYGFGS